MLTHNLKKYTNPKNYVKKARHLLHLYRLKTQIQPNTVQQEISQEISPAQLDHLIHDMFLANKLDDLTNQQVVNILHTLSSKFVQLTSQQMEDTIYAIQMAGHLSHFKDTRDAVYDDGHLISFHSADFLNDPLFIEAYKLGHATNSWLGMDIRWRVYVVCWAAAHAKLLDGDFVECGVNRGGFSRAVMHYINFQTIQDKTFYLLDTFCGIPKQDHHLADLYHDAYSECYEEVKETFKSFNNVNIIRGRVPDTLHQVPSKKIAYLSIDMNYAEPEIATAEFFWDKLVTGGVMVLDDYGAGIWHKRQRQAFDQFAKEKGTQVLLLPSCQGLIFKP